MRYTKADSSKSFAHNFSASKIYHHIMTIARETELSEVAVARFDKLVQQGEIIWQDSKPRYISATPFDVPAYTGL
jgi:hypothetical protein